MIMNVGLILGDEAVHDEETIKNLKGALTCYRSNFEDWAKYTNFDKEKYTRNIVQRGTYYHIVILCWCPGHCSPVHGHSGSHCHMKVLSGELEELIYEKHGNKTLKHLGKNDTTYIHDSIGVHQIQNPSKNKVAVSFHIYSPPIHL